MWIDWGFVCVRLGFHVICAEMRRATGCFDCRDGTAVVVVALSHVRTPLSSSQWRQTKVINGHLVVFCDLIFV